MIKLCKAGKIGWFLLSGEWGVVVTERELEALHRLLDSHYKIKPSTGKGVGNK